MMYQITDAQKIESNLNKKGFQQFICLLEEKEMIEGKDVEVYKVFTYNLNSISVTTLSN